MPTANKDAATSERARGERARGESSTDNSREEIDEVLLAGSSSDYSGVNPSPCAQVSAKLSDVGVGLKGSAPNPNCYRCWLHGGSPPIPNQGRDISGNRWSLAICLRVPSITRCRTGLAGRLGSRSRCFTNVST